MTASPSDLLRGGSGGTPKVSGERARAPATTLERVRPLFGALEITRVADITGLDRVGIPTFAVYRPNSRSVSVAQGKGATAIEAEVSGVMESIETWHAERVAAPLLLGSARDLGSAHPIVDTRGLPRLAVSTFGADSPLLWASGVDLLSGQRKLVPYEMVHLDCRPPLPTGSGAFLMSSNGLASGNELVEATNHALCELVERDAGTLWHLGGARGRRVDPRTVDDERCLALLGRFEAAGIAVGIHETTSDVALPSFLCTVVDRDPLVARPMPPVSGSGCHPRRRVALLRALSEAAQGRLTLIAGARDDLGGRVFDAAAARQEGERVRASLAADRCDRAFGDAPDFANDDLDADLRLVLGRLAAAGLREVVAVNLTRPAIGIPVVKVIVPYLEAMSELPGYVPGRRARAVMAS